MSSLEGKVAFITGIARGQGRAHAVRLAEAGADIIGVDVCAAFETVNYDGATEEDLAQTVAEVEKLDRRIVAEVADVRDLAQMEAVVAKGLQELGRLDIVVANAGIANGGLLWEITPEQWKEVLDVCLTGVWHTLKVTVPRMIEQGTGGAIVLTSSVSGLRGLPFLGHYNAAKHGVVGLARTLANEVGEYNIRVNTIHPNGVNTHMMQDRDLLGRIEAVPHTLGPIWMNALPVQYCEPVDIANVVAFMVSDENRYMTGSQIPIDFGTLGR